MLEGITAPQVWRPPHMSYVMLAGFLDQKVRETPLPPRIDRSYLRDYGETVQAQLLTVLGLLGLADPETGFVGPRLRAVAGNPEVRRRTIRAWATSFYREQLALAAEDASAASLYASFGRRGVKGSTLRKAVAFYLALCDDVGLVRSPHFRHIQQGASVEDPILDVPGCTPVQHREFRFGEAGSISLWTDLQHPDLPPEILDRLQRVLHDLEDLASSAAERDEDG